MGTFHRWELLQTVTEDVTRRGTEMSDGTNGEAARESPIRAGFRCRSSPPPLIMKGVVRAQYIYRRLPPSLAALMHLARRPSHVAC